MKHWGILISAFIFISGCNPEEYFPIEEYVLGEDAFCSEAKDLDSCRSLGDRCQGAFLDLEKDDQEPIFAACVSNPAHNTPEELSEEPAEGQPSIEDAINGKCQDLDMKYLYVKKIVSKNETKVISKIKVCHSTDRGEHTIIIACPALRAHANHHDGNDYLGACQ